MALGTAGPGSANQTVSFSVAQLLPMLWLHSQASFSLLHERCDILKFSSLQLRIEKEAGPPFSLSVSILHILWRGSCTQI